MMIKYIGGILSDPMILGIVNPLSLFHYRYQDTKHRVLQSFFLVY